MKKLLIVLLVLGLAAPAMAAEVTISGSNWIMFCYQSQDEDWSGIEDGDVGGSNDGLTAGGSLKAENNILYIPKAGKSNNINFRAKASDTLSSWMEIGLGPGGTDSDDSAYVKHALATWNFGAGKLSFGWGEAQDTWMAAFPVFVDAGPYIANGSMYHVRKSVIQLEIASFGIALRENTGQPGAGAAAAYDDVDAFIPEISASYAWANKMFFIKGAGGFQTYTVVDNVADESLTINSYNVSLQTRVTFGPANIGVGGYYAVNPSNEGFIVVNVPGGYTLDANGDVEDATVAGGSLTGGVKISPSLGFNAGFVYQTGEQMKNSRNCANVFVNLDTKIGPIMVTPEIGYQVKDEDRGSRMYFSTLFKVFW